MGKIICIKNVKNNSGKLLAIKNKEYVFGYDIKWGEPYFVNENKERHYFNPEFAREYFMEIDTLN